MPLDPVPQIDEIDAVLDGLSSAPTLDVYEAMLPYDGDMVAAAAAHRALAGGGGGDVVAFAPHDRNPENGLNAIWSLELTGSPDGGTFTLLISVAGGDPVETGPIDWDEVNLDDPNPSLQTILDAALGAGTTSASGGPLPAAITIAFLANTAIDIEVGDNSLTGGTDPAPSLNQTQVGTPADGLPEGAGWWNDDAVTGWVNNGDESSPDWVQLGDVVNGQSSAIDIGGGITAKGFTSESVVSGGGTGFNGDEYNIHGYDDSDGAVIIALSTDPTETPPSQNYIRGTLLLRNDESTIGQLWLKTGENAGDWTRVALMSDIP